MKWKSLMSIDIASIEQTIIELKMYRDCIIQWMKKLLIRLTKECEALGMYILYDTQRSTALEQIIRWLLPKIYQIRKTKKVCEDHLEKNEM